MEKIPDIKPIKLKEYNVKQSKYNMVGRIPIRQIVLGPSGCGKGIYIQNEILDIYKNMFSRIYIFSPSIEVDFQTWKPVKDYIEKEMGLKHTEEEPIYFGEYDAEALNKIINQQRKVCELQKKENHKTLHQILIVIDDFADNPEFSRQSRLLHSLFTRGRHSGISTICSTQKFTALHPILRVNASELIVFRLRNYSDLITFLDEVCALIDKQTLLQVYNLATEEPYSFLYCNLTAKKKNDIFMINYGKKINFEE